MDSQLVDNTLERYEYCLKLLISVMYKVADGKISIEELKRFIIEMETGEELSEDKN